MYLKDKNIVTTLNARERAPRLSTKDMFVGKPEASTTGGLAVAIPGEIKGIWELHQKYGSLPWADLIQPNIDLCKEGILVTEYLASVMKSYENQLRNEPSLREIFINPVTNQAYVEGDKVKRLKLAETLEIIAKDGVDTFYGGGEIGRKFVQDVQSYGGILTEKDLKDYRVEWRDSVNTEIINDAVLHTMPLPSSGSMLLLILNMLRDFSMQPNALGFHRITEAFKIAFADRSWIGSEETDTVKEIVRKMGMKDYADLKKNLINDEKTTSDTNYYGAYNGTVIEDHGTAHLSILAPNGDAISVTNTINDVFGAFFRSMQTGIIANDEMDDFAVPENIQDGVHPSPNNFVIPYNNPISSMVPSIVIDKNGDVELVVGGAGGRRIITGTFLTLYRYLYFNETIEDALAAPRFHHQLSPVRLDYESSFDSAIIGELNTKYEHTLRELTAIASIVAISKHDGKVSASSDPRRGGSALVFEGNF